MMYNKRIKSAKKFSNVVIFDRREKDASLRKRFRYSFKSEKDFNHDLQSTSHNKSNLKLKQIKNMYPTLSTNLETNIYPNFFPLKDKCITKNNSIISKKTTRPCTANYNKFFLDNKSTFVTETLIATPNQKNLYLHKKIIKRNNINPAIQEYSNYINTYDITKNKIVDILYNDEIDSKRSDFINFSKTENADILKSFRTTDNGFLNKKNIKGKSKTIKDLKKYHNICYNKTIEYKTKQINRKKEISSELINKNKKMLLIQYISNLKLEKAIRLKENFQSQLDYFDQLKNSLYSFKKLFNVTLFDKITDYIKFLNYKKDLENLHCSQLEEEKFSISHEIFHINNKKEKLQSEKDNIMRWIFFQIRIKERKLKLPFYYKIILENNIQKIIPEKKEKRNVTNIKKEDNTTKSNRNSPPIKSNKNIHKKRKSVRTGSVKIASTQPKILDSIKYKFSINNFNNNFVNKEVFYFVEFNIEDSTFEKELLRINKYKENLIFQDCEEITEQFKYIENKNIMLMDYNDHLSKQLFLLKKELKLIKAEKQKIENDNESRIKRKEIEKNEIYKDAENKQYTYNTIKFNIPNKNYNVKKRTKSANIVINKFSTKNSLSDKINILFETCKKMNTYNNDDDIFNEIKNNKKKNKIGKRSEILLKLKFIENVVNSLCAEIEKITNGNSIKLKKALKKVVFEIERKHIIKNYQLQKRKKLEKELELLNQIEERNNKIYFLPYKKVNYAGEEMFKKKQEIKNNLEKINNEPEIMKFLSDN